MAYYNLTVDGQTATAISNGTRLHVMISGTWGAGTAKLQFLDDQSSPVWTDVTGASWTANTATVVELAPTEYSFRIDLSGATSPDLDITLK